MCWPSPPITSLFNRFHKNHNPQMAQMINAKFVNREGYHLIGIFKERYFTSTLKRILSGIQVLLCVHLVGFYAGMKFGKFSVLKYRSVFIVGWIFIRLVFCDIEFLEFFGFGGMDRNEISSVFGNKKSEVFEILTFLAIYRVDHTWWYTRLLRSTRRTIFLKAWFIG